MIWESAKTHCSVLGLDGHTDWRLPDIGELRSLIRGCPTTEWGSSTCNVQPGGCLDSSCNDGDLCEYCGGDNGPADGCYWPDQTQGECWRYWSSSGVADNGSNAWNVNFSYGRVSGYSVYYNAHVRCVR